VSGSSSRAADALIARVALLEQIVSDQDRLPADLAQRAAEVASTARARLGHGTSHTVVALAGGTGSGKSSLFNALAGQPLSTVGVRRPTTSATQAAVYGAGAEPLLDWLQIEHRSRIASPELDGLVLLDLPDHDSTAAAHLAEVDRLVEVVDAFCWVVDPQKYADAALHEGYLRSFAGHSAVTMVALNQIDRLATPADRQACLGHLGRLLEADGLIGVRVLPVSAATGEGVADLRRELSARVAERRAVVARIDADVDWLASDLAAACGDVTPAPVPDASRRAVIDAAVIAAGGAEVEIAVDKAFRHRASLAVGWPPLRWTRNLRPDPLRRLGLGRTASSDGALGGRGLGRSAASGSGGALGGLSRASASGSSGAPGGGGLSRASASGSGGAPGGSSSSTSGGVLGRIGLGSRRTNSADGALAGPVRRTAIIANTVGVAQLEGAGRDMARTVTVGLPPTWRDRISASAIAAVTDLPDPLDAAVGGLDLPVSPPKWWTAAGLLQRLVSGTMLVGVLWLALIAALGWFKVPALPLPKWHGWPVPTLLALGGAAVGLSIAFLGRRIAIIGGRRRAARFRRDLRQAVETVVDANVITPTNAELSACGTLTTLIRRLG
jgi:energy-coupling factor transporter ATP-binding protein EcfA2